MQGGDGGAGPAVLHARQKGVRLQHLESLSGLVASVYFYTIEIDRVITFIGLKTVWIRRMYSSNSEWI